MKNKLKGANFTIKDTQFESHVVSKEVLELIQNNNLGDDSVCVDDLVSIRMKDNATLVHIAAIEGNQAGLKDLYEYGLSMDTSMINGLTPAHAAAVNGHSHCLRLLQRYGCDIESNSDEGWKPVHLAAFNGHLKCLKLLHRYDCDMHTRKNNGDTPLMLAAERGNLECVAFLRECHWKPELKKEMRSEENNLDMSNIKTKFYQLFKAHLNE